MLLLASADFFQNELLKKFFHDTIRVIGSRSGPPVCKGYQQIIEVAAERV